MVDPALSFYDLKQGPWIFSLGLWSIKMNISVLKKISLVVFVITLIPAMLLFNGTEIAFMFSRMLSVVAGIALTFNLLICNFRPQKPWHLGVDFPIVVALFCSMMYATSIAASAPYELFNGSKIIGTKSINGLGSIIGLGSSLNQEWTAHWILSGVGLLFSIGTLLVLFFVYRNQEGGYLPENSTTALART